LEQAEPQEQAQVVMAHSVLIPFSAQLHPLAVVEVHLLLQ
jgi:hypothetical protein